MSNVVDFPVLPRIRRMWSDGSVAFTRRAERQMERSGIYLLDFERMIYDDATQMLHSERHRGEIRCAIEGPSPDGLLRLTAQFGVGSDVLRIVAVDARRGGSPP